MATLVTGGAGYIGSHAAVALHESGREVILVDNLSNSCREAVEAIRSLTSPDMAFVEADLRDRSAIDAIFNSHSIDEVVHFAAFKSVGDSVNDPVAYYDNNLGSTLRLVEAMLSHGVRRLVYSSSCTVYGQPEIIPVNESAATGAQSPYGWTKYMCEQILRDTCEAHDLDAMLLRYFNPVGAHQSGTIGENPVGTPNNLVPYVMMVAAGRLEKLQVFGSDYDTSDGTAIRDYLHVTDLAEGHVAALDALAGGATGCEAVNLGTGVGTTVLQVLSAAERAVGRAIPFEMVGRRNGDIEKIWADPSYAEELLGWTATRGLDQMMGDHWNWQKSHPDGFNN